MTLLLAMVGWAYAAAGARFFPAHRSGGRWRIVALSLAAVLSLALTFELPYLALVRLTPQAQVVRVPARWMIPASFALSALAGFGLSAFHSPAHRRLHPHPEYPGSPPNLGAGRRFDGRHFG